MDPLPLIQPPKTSQIDAQRLAVYGYAILIGTWLVFVVTINSMFGVWRWVIAPLPQASRRALVPVLTTIDEYVVSMWGIYVVVWWWAVALWVGLKLFRHSRGIRPAD